MDSARSGNAGRREPSWRAKASYAVRQYGGGIQLLVEAAEFGLESLGAGEPPSEEETGARPGLALARLFAARAISTLDAAIALLQAGCVDQVEMLMRSLHDLFVDAYLVMGDSRGYRAYTDFALIEQAVLARKLDPARSPWASDQELIARREELARELRLRLRESHPEAEANLEADAPLEQVLRKYSRKRMNRPFPRTWRDELEHAHALKRDDWPPVIAKVLIEVTLTGDAAVPLELFSGIREQVEQELATVTTMASSEIHNSPLAMNRKVDPATLAVSIHGPTAAVPRQVLALFLQYYRILIVHEQFWCGGQRLDAWNDLRVRLDAWSSGQALM